MTSKMFLLNVGTEDTALLVDGRWIYISFVGKKDVNIALWMDGWMDVGSV